MILTIDTAGKKFTVTNDPRPKLDSTGEQRVSKKTGLPQWSTEVVVTDESGGEIITVTTDNDSAPAVVREDPVDVRGLVATFWVGKGRSGTSYRAESITVAGDDGCGRG